MRCRIAGGRWTAFGLDQLNEISDIREPADFGGGESHAKGLLHREYKTDVVQAVPAIDVPRRQRRAQYELRVIKEIVKYLCQPYIDLRRLHRFLQSRARQGGSPWMSSISPTLSTV